MEDLKKQAERFGTDVRFGIVTSVEFCTEGGIHKVTVDENKVIEAEAVIIATGATAKYLGLPDEVKYAGQGVSACATCDGFFYRKKVVAVVGGGDTACEEAIYLANLASKVYLIVRRNELRASKIMQARVLKCENIEVLWETQTLGLFGDNGVEGMNLVRYKGTEKEEIVSIPIDGFFLAIGHKPNTDVFASYLELDPLGYIITEGVSTKTNIPGVFAAGDVADTIKEPKPYVLQTSLDDFYVSYQLCAFSQTPDKQAVIYSELNQNIQDVFAENDVEIMSPHYKAIRNGNASTIPHSEKNETPSS